MLNVHMDANTAERVERLSRHETRTILWPVPADRLLRWSLTVDAGLDILMSLRSLAAGGAPLATVQAPARVTRDAGSWRAPPGAAALELRLDNGGSLLRGKPPRLPYDALVPRPRFPRLRGCIIYVHVC